MQVQGVINGEYIKLFNKTSLPDGLLVIVNIRTKPPIAEEKLNLIDKLCGSWKNDSSLESVFAEIRNQRHQNKPRELIFDAAS
jgi:hypothetical protein